MSAPLKVLIAEDSDDDVELVIRELRSGGFEPDFTVVRAERELVRALNSAQWDLIISDYSMPNFDGLHCLRLYRERDLDVPFILVSGTVGEELAVDAMKAGAHDYVMKGRLNRLVPAIKRELKEAQVRRENKRMTEYLEFLAYHDPVTNLPNQRHFQEILKKILEENAHRDGPVAVAVVEISNLGTIRNVLGIETVNRLMHGIAQRLQSQIVEAERIGRLNDNSFGVMVALQADSELEAFGTLCLDIFDNPIELEISQLHADPNIGIAAFPAHGSTAETVLRNAYVAATQATERSRPFHIYSQADDRATPERLKLLGELRHAIRADDLLLHYQPIVDLGSGAIVATEALVRWQHRDRGLIPPGLFLEGAEQSGLIQPLTKWVIRDAFEQWKRWEEAGNAVPLFVNLSVRTVENGGLPAYVRSCVEETRVKPEALGFEVTESAIMQDYKVANRVLLELHDMGFKIAIDDFGTGHSSLRYIQRLPIDHIKIDRSFIAELTPRSDEFTIVKAILDIANNLDMEVVAEGVERRETLALLKQMGCHLAQGYLFSKPVGAHDISALLANRAAPPWQGRQPDAGVPLGES